MANAPSVFMRAEGDGLGIIELSLFSIQLWRRKIDCDGVVSWVLEKIIELDNLLSLDKRQRLPKMLGFCEDNNVVFIWTVLGIFMVDLGSMKFKKPPVQSYYCVVHPFTSVYTADMGIGGGHDEADLLCDA